MAFSRFILNEKLIQHLKNEISRKVKPSNLLSLDGKANFRMNIPDFEFDFGLLKSFVKYRLILMGYKSVVVRSKNQQILVSLNTEEIKEQISLENLDAVEEFVDELAEEVAELSVDADYTSDGLWVERMKLSVIANEGVDSEFVISNIMFYLDALYRFVGWDSVEYLPDENSITLVFE